MKPMLAACLCALLLLSIMSTAQEAAKTKSTDAAPNSMKGAYSMLAQKLNIDGKDSILSVQQFKIYTDRHFMYAHNLPGDSLGAFGIGTYRVQNGKVIESPFYTSSGPTQDTFELAINKTAEGYSQVINFPPDSLGRKYVLTEDYRNASRNVSTPLDGAWKMIRVTFHPQNGNPVVVNDIIQYKVYQSGNVIWANSYLDSATQRRATAFGFGSFKMNGANQAVETIAQSTYRTALEDQSITLQLKFDGKNRYQQTIVGPNGSKQIEEYERLQ